MGWVRTAFILCAATVLPCAAASGAELIRYEFVGDGGGNIAAGLLSLTPGYVWYGDPVPALFADDRWAPADVGTTRIATAATDPAFSAFAAWLTDGVAQDMEFRAGFDATGGTSFAHAEAYFAFGDPSDPRVDLHGLTIDRVLLTLDALTLATPGQDPNGDGLWTDYTVRYTVVVEGAVPEPAGAMVTALASLALLRRHRR